VGHLLDVLVERLRCFEERLEVGTQPEALQVPVRRIPLDADDLLVGLVDAAGGFPPQAVRRCIEKLAGPPVGASNSSLRLGSIL
jgi:hypothetical protein